MNTPRRTAGTTTGKIAPMTANVHTVCWSIPLVCALCAWLMNCVPAQAQPVQGVTFLATWQNAWLRAAPSVNAPKVTPLVQGATFGVVARTADSQWLALSAPAANLKAWLPAGFGQVNGNLTSVPVVSYALPATPKNTNSAPWPDWIKLGPRAKALFQTSIKTGRDGRMFSIAGDSNSTWQRDMGRIASGVFNFDKFGYLRTVVTRFDPAIARVSVAVHGGIGATNMFDPALAKQQSSDCADGEGMFACELRQSRASIVFLQLGTGDKFAWRDFEKNTRRMIELALASNVLPVLVTKADDLESIQGGASFGYINDTLRKLANEYLLPLVDFYAATRTMPVIPNPELPKRPFTQFGLQDEWGYYFHLTDEGRALRVQSTLMMLDAITRGM